MSRKRKEMTSPEKPEKKSKSAFILEEENVKIAKAPSDLKAFHGHCDELRQLFNATLKKKVAHEKVHIGASVKHFLGMKELNRHMHFRLKHAREVTHEKKLEIDEHHLRLQNLLYEVMHLEKEISKCLEFRSRDQDIHLVSTDEFYKNAPSEISKPEHTKKDQHQQTLARLAWELEERKRLTEKQKLSKHSVDVIKKEIKSKQEYLESLQPKLREIAEVTKPVQDFMNLKFFKEQEENSLAMLLPPALYILFTQVKAFSQSIDKTISVSIEGDAEVARTAFQVQEESSIDVIESDPDDLEGERKRKKHRRRSKSTREKDNLEKVIRLHPLVVNVDVNIKTDVSLHLKFSYLTVLKVVTVKVSLNRPSSFDVSVTAGDIFSVDSLLTHLYPSDSGSFKPLLWVRHEIRRAGWPHEAGGDRLQEQKARIGTPYLWVQKLAGVECVPLEASQEESFSKALKPSPEIAFSHVEDCFRRLRERIGGRLNLVEQIVAVEKHMLVVEPHQQTLLPAKTEATLSALRKSTFSDFAVLDNAKKALEEGLAHEWDIYLTLEIQRGLHQAVVSMVVPVDFPQHLPLFILTVSGDTQTGLPRTNINDLQIAALEKEVNCHLSEFSADGKGDKLLLCQILRLTAAFDIYCRYEMGERDQQGRVLRHAKYPSRSCPYKYLARLDTFVQR